MRIWIIAITLLLMTSQAGAATEVRGVRLWRAPDNTRLVFDLSGPVSHRLFTLAAPERVVIDVDQASLRTPLDQLALGNTPIRGIRAAGHGANGLRLVLDLSAQVSPKTFTLAPNQEYGHRLVVDLYDPGAAPAPLVARRALASSSGPIRALPSARRDIIIAVDAGHGGEDPGALGPGKVREKDVVLGIAKRLAKRLSAIKGYQGKLVRTGDYFIPLRRRTEIARAKDADLFVSIHADAAPRTSASGASVYALSDRGATSETARWLADTENRSDLIGGTSGTSMDDDLAGVLLDLSMTASMSSSLNVGKKVLTRMGKKTHLHKRQVEQAGFMVLKSPDMPSILVETGFITNPREARKLQTASHQNALAAAIASGIEEFFREAPPAGTYIAWLRDQGRLSIGPREHVVRSGDSLALLAQRYDVPLDALRQANDLNGDVIRIGQTLKIPAPTLAGQ